MPVGPRGEKRPVSSVSSMVKAMRVATGIDEEEYVERPKKKSPIDPELDEDDIAAFETGKPKKRRRRKSRKRD